MTAARIEGRTRYDAVLLGAGPAGCAAAHYLAGRGARVLLIDFREGRTRKGEVLNSFVRPVLSSLGLVRNGCCGLSPVIAGSVLKWGGPTREYSTISCPNGSNYLVDRQLFDESLRRIARAAGAELRSVGALPIATRARSHWEVEIREQQQSSYSVKAPLLIDASGRRASVVRRFGQRVKLDRLVCIYYLTFGIPASDRDHRWFLAADPDGWWFSVRVGRGERIFCRFTEASGNIGADWWAAMSEACPELAAIAEAHGYVPKQRMVFDAGTSYSSFSVAGLAAAGDAAFSIDPLSAQGLASALSQGLVVGSYACGYLAGRAQALTECRMIQRQELRRMLADMTAAYAREPRWRDSRFWAQRTALAH